MTLQKYNVFQYLPNIFAIIFTFTPKFSEMFTKTGIKLPV